MNTKSFHDEDGWSRVLERRPPVRKTSMRWEKITKLQCQKSVPQWHDFFKKNNKNNTEFLGAEIVKETCQNKNADKKYRTTYLEYPHFVITQLKTQKRYPCTQYLFCVLNRKNEYQKRRKQDKITIWFCFTFVKSKRNRTFDTFVSKVMRSARLCST